MYKNYIFDLYGTLIDIRTDEWQAALWKKIALLYGYHGASYTYKELGAEYGRLIDKEKKNVRRRHPEYTVIDIKIDKVFRQLFTLKGVRPTKAQVLFIAEAFRCYSTKLLKLYDGVTVHLTSLTCSVCFRILTEYVSAPRRSAQNPIRIILGSCLTATVLKKASRL